MFLPAYIRIPTLRIQRSTPREPPCDAIGVRRRCLLQCETTAWFIGATSPIGSCEAGRSFSALGCIKSHMRTSMEQDRLAGLPIMAVRSSRVHRVDTQAIVNNYIHRQSPGGCSGGQPNSRTNWNLLSSQTNLSPKRLFFSVVGVFFNFWFQVLVFIFLCNQSARSRKERHAVSLACSCSCPQFSWTVLH